MFPLAFFLFLQTLEIQLHYIPPGVPCTGPDKLEARCYGFEDYKKLILVDEALDVTIAKGKEKDAIISEQGLIIQQKDIVIQMLESDKKILAERATRLEDKWNLCLAEQDNFPWWVAITGGASLGIIAGVAVGAVATYLLISP